MNDYDLIAEQIEEINIKLKEIDKQMIIVEDIKPQFGQMDTFIPDLEAAYKDFDNSLSNSIFKTQELNKIVINDAIGEYTDIYHELNEKCKTIIDELLESVNIVDEPAEIEVLDMTPISSNTYDVEVKEVDPLYGTPLITQDFIDKQVSIIQPIEKSRINPDIIPLPTPVQPEIEVLEL